MAQRKLLKAPARRLLLTFVVTAGVAVSINAAAPRASPKPVPGNSPPPTGRSRVRQPVDYSQIEGIQRWGLNE